MYFLALSQAPPVLEAEMAIWMPETIIPGRRPATTLGPKRMPRQMGVAMTLGVTGRRGAYEDARGDHLAERGVGGDLDASVVVGLFGTVDDTGVVSDLSSDLLDHFEGGFADGLHGHSGERVGEHGTDDETGEDEGVGDDDGLVAERVREIGVVGVHGPGDEGAEEGHADEGGGADGEALADSGGGVTGRVEGVGLLPEELSEGAHFGDAAGVVGDGSVGVDGETDRERGEHPEGGEADAEHAEHLVREVGDEREDDGGEDAGEVAEGETVDDVGGGTSLTGLGDSLCGAVGVTGVVLSKEPDGEPAPKAGSHSDESGKAGDSLEARAILLCALVFGGLGSGGTAVVDLAPVVGQENLAGEVDRWGHQGGRVDKLELELVLDRGQGLHREALAALLPLELQERTVFQGVVAHVIFSILVFTRAVVELVHE